MKSPQLPIYFRSFIGIIKTPFITIGSGPNLVGVKMVSFKGSWTSLGFGYGSRVAPLLSLTFLGSSFEFWFWPVDSGCVPPFYRVEGGWVRVGEDEDAVCCILSACPKTNYLLLSMGIFQCHVSFRGVLLQFKPLVVP